MNPADSADSLGWRPFFAAQLERPGLAGGRPARVLAVHRDRLELAGADVPAAVPAALQLDATVGDWLVLDGSADRAVAVLDRQSVFKRRSAGEAATTQLIAANVDTLFIVTSANRDFNVARLERYLAVAYEGGALPVVVITKADTVETVEPFISQAAGLAPGVVVEALDARDPAAAEVLRPWCGNGQTVALLGSSGVGKSTLINTLAGTVQSTRAARADDQRGRHTTTGRSMHRLPAGGWLIDTPGMRELRLVDVADALDDVFGDITSLGEQCRFSDCLHETEPGCAVRRAIERGELDVGRLRRYRKLAREDRHNTMTVAERRSRDRQFGKLYKSIQSAKRHDKGSRN